MKIVKLQGESTDLKVISDLTRLSGSSSQKFITHQLVKEFLRGDINLDFKTSNFVSRSHRVVQYMRQFSKTNITMSKTDYFAAILCAYSEDSLARGIINDSYYEKEEEFREVLKSTSKYNFNGVILAPKVMDFMTVNKTVELKSPDIPYILYNLCLYWEGMCLILEDNDSLDSTLGLQMKYKVENLANKILRDKHYEKT